MMLRYPCLVLDHDDTVVQSETTINYPYFCYILDYFRPGETITLNEYIQGCCSVGFVEMCRQRYGFTDEELQEEYRGWKAFVRSHIPATFPGIEKVIHRQKAEGGILCVVSHSSKEIITRDYTAHFGDQPDAIYDCDLPESQQKPNPYPLEDIMRRYGLNAGEILVVDDMRSAWEMASKVHVSVAFAAWGRKDHPEITRQMTALCDYSFDSPQELEHFLFY